MNELRKRASRIAFWAVPPLICLVLYWPGLMAWFQKDDFAWLGLRDLVHNWRDLLWALFAPLSQGTIRTFSERVLFMSFSAMFGLHALPFRIWVFITGAATLTMLSVVCTKLTASRAAGFWAAVLWIVNSTTAFVFSWTAIYYELLLAFTILLTFWFFLRYVETGERRFYIAQWITFLFGFGVLELNVVYPALALAYALSSARSIISKILPLFIPAALYTWLHMAAAPLHTSGPYKMYWDSSIFRTLWVYWNRALGPNRLIYLGIYPSRFRSALAIVLMAGLLGFAAWKLCRRKWIAAFYPAWFVIVLAPLLPLQDHISDYYLTVPMIGVAMWGAWAFISGWHTGLAGKVAAVAVLSVYLCVSVPVARVNSASFYDYSHKIRRQVLSVVDRSRSYAGKAIILKGVRSAMFWGAVRDHAFELFGVNEIYVALEDQSHIAGHLPEDDHFFIGPIQAKHMLEQNRAVVLDVSYEQ